MRDLQLENDGIDSLDHPNYEFTEVNETPDSEMGPDEEIDENDDMGDAKEPISGDDLPEKEQIGDVDGEIADDEEVTE